jgi:glyoxylase-like metal-dependent hydrolase (beta-lactamase superfamily II)/predicted membrane-bound spermidine synthase
LFGRACFILFVLDVALGIAHLLWPEYRWGQGRASYFNFDNTQTLASWLATMQLVAVAVLALAAFHQERQVAPEVRRARWPWTATALLALLLSAAESTRVHERFSVLSSPEPDLFQQLVALPLQVSVLALFGWFFWSRLRGTSDGVYPLAAWVVTWAAALLLRPLLDGVTSSGDSAHWISLFRGLAYLLGGTFLLRVVGICALHLGAAARERATDRQPDPGSASPLPARTASSGPLDAPSTRSSEGRGQTWILIGVAGMTFTIVFLQVVLFQVLTITGDHVTAHGVISIGLLGIAVGGLVGFLRPRSSQIRDMTVATLLLPVGIVIAFGAAASFGGSPAPTSLLLGLPFACSSAVISLAMIRIRSHVVYCVDLIGAACGALAVGPSLRFFREEGSLLFLISLTLLCAGCFLAASHRTLRSRRGGAVLAMSLAFVVLGCVNLRWDWLNITEARIRQRYPKAEVLFSESSLVGRYDIARNRPGAVTLAAYENGRIIDRIRRIPPEEHRIDPRLPHTLYKDPSILILGVSGDGVTKTAKQLGKEVHGVEINPAIVDLQTKHLRAYNLGSYEGIRLRVMDGRSYLQQTDRRYDMITLMNAHSARGHDEGRAASPEYLHTREAMATVLDHLTDRGVLIVEEPINRPGREISTWKLLVTMRQAVLDRGSRAPERHFFVFQWRTRNHNYVQILMKRNPFIAEELARLKRWLSDVDGLRLAETTSGMRMGPIQARTTILHAPDQLYMSNYSRILRGLVGEDFLRAHNLVPVTDDRPFLFDIDPAHSALKGVYIRTLLLMSLVAAMLFGILKKKCAGRRGAAPYVLVAILTGLGYLLVEVVLIQRYQIFLGSPVAAFSTVLGSLLLFSGCGSLWSGRIGARGLATAWTALILCLLAHLKWVPSWLSSAAAFPLAIKVLLVVLSLAPAAFFLGTPFPFVLRLGKQRLGDPAAAALFGINAAVSAAAVPLALNISTSNGLNATLQAGILLYLPVGLLLVSMHKRAVPSLARGSALAAIALLLLWPWVPRRSDSRMEDGPGRYRVYAASYGHSSLRADKLLENGSPDLHKPAQWFFWIIQGQGRTMLVDTGFHDRRLASDWRIRDYVAPTERLAQLNISPRQVSDVVLTHAHWDHIGDLAAYENATVWIQEREYRHAASTVSAARLSAHGMRWEDLLALSEARREGRVRLVRGTESLVTGVMLTADGSHTPGHQHVTVQTADGSVVLSGDATYLYLNNQRHRPIGAAVDHDANLAAIRHMQRRAASSFYIIPGHDPRLLKWFPEISPGIVQVAAAK